jgi:hypothetical protein
MIEKMSHIMPRSCNYSNTDRIIEQAKYDEDKNQYILPEPTRENVQLPHMENVAITNNGRMIQNDYIIPSKSNSIPTTETEYEEDFIVADGYSTTNYEDMDKRYGRNPEPPEKTRIKRQEQLLNENSVLQRAKRPLQMNNMDNDYMNRRLNPHDVSARLSRKYGFSSDKQ